MYCICPKCSKPVNKYDSPEFASDRITVQGHCTCGCQFTEYYVYDKAIDNDT